MISFPRRVLHEEQFHFGITGTKREAGLRHGGHVARYLQGRRPRPRHARETRPKNLRERIPISQHEVIIGQRQQRLIRRLRIGNHRFRRPIATLPRRPIQLIGDRHVVLKNDEHVTNVGTREICRQGRNPRCGR